jgi:hypothetical protein
MTQGMSSAVRGGAFGLGIVLVGGVLAAVPAGAAPTWTSPIVTLDDTDQSQDVEVAVDAAGNATAVWVLDGDAEVSIKASTHPVGGTWSAPVDIAAPGDSFDDVDLATSADSGVTVAVWSQTVGGHNVVHAATRSPGGAWSAPLPLSGADHDATDPQVGLDAAGGGIVSWIDGVSPFTQRYATRSAAGAWSAPADVPEGPTEGNLGDAYELAVGRGGHAVWAWEMYDTALSRRVIEASYRPAGGGFGTPQVMSAASVDTWDPQVAVNATGVATVSWRESPIGGSELHSRTREAGGAWSAIQAISDDFVNQHQDIVVDAAGTTTAVWAQVEPPQPSRILYATRPAGGDWDAPQLVAPPGDGLAEPSLAIDASGRMTVAFVVWGATDEIGARTRAPGGAWTDHGLVSALPAGAEGASPTVVMDDAGQAVVAWRAIGSPDLAQLRALDSQGPLPAGLAIPAMATVGQPATFAWPAVDAWSAVSSVAWTFGDGSSGSGSSVTKTYGAPGTYPVSVTATDAVGNATTRSGSVVVTASPVAVVVPKPQLTGVKLTKKTIHVKGSDESPKATKLKLRLNTDAKVKVVLKRTQKVDGKTVKATVKKALKKGSSAIKLTSKVGGKRLPPGTYKIVVTAKNPVGRSAPTTVRLTIKK